jgi:hypothetical protein
MSCCGNKRQAFYLSNRPAPVEVAIAGDRIVNIRNRGPVQAETKFRYTGNQSLYIKGTFNRRGYHFSASSPEQMVSAGDAALLRGHPELIEIKTGSPG